MSGKLFLVFTVLCSVLLAETAVDIRTKKVLVHTLESCKGKRNLPQIWKGFTYRHNEATGDAFANLTVTNRIEIKDISIVFNFWKCDASGNPDSCEYVLKDQNITDICTYMVEKGQMWTIFMDAWDKPMKCPIKPGEYHIVNLKIGPEFLSMMPISDAVWKVQMLGQDHGKAFTCVFMVLQVQPYYKRRQS